MQQSERTPAVSGDYATASRLNILCVRGGDTLKYGVPKSRYESGAATMSSQSEHVATGADEPAATSSGITQIVIAPNASMTVRQAQWFMLSISVIALGIGIGFAWIGFWVILPFAGLEVAALGAALYVSLRHNADREVITVSGNTVVVEFGRTDQPQRRSRREFTRACARVVFEQGASRLRPSRLRIGAPAQGVRLMPLGTGLTDAERAALAQRLRQVLAHHSPADWSKA